MTVSFTPYCRKPERWISSLASLSFGLFLLSLFTLSWAASSNLNIKSAELVPLENVYALNANFEINFSKEVEEALNKGVQLDFLIEFQIVSPSTYWFDDEIKSTSMHVTMGCAHTQLASSGKIAAYKRRGILCGAAHQA
jgi:hypothetical protein